MKTIFIIFAVAVMTVIFASYYFSESPWDTPAFSNDSEALVTRKISSNLSLLDDLQQKGGFLYVEKDKKTAKIPGLYTSQVGLQGLILNATQKILRADADNFIGFSRIFFSLFSALVLGLILLTVWNEFGWITSLISLFLIISSFWVVAFAKNLYWAEFTMLLPLAAGWYVYPKLIKRRKPFANYLLITTILVLVKSLNGYEYITNIILGASIGPLYYELANKVRTKILAQKILLIIFSGIAGFLIAYLIHYLQLFLFTHDFQKSFDLLTERAVIRTLGNNPYITGCDFSNYFIVILKYLNAQSLFRTHIPLVWMLGAYAIGIVPLIPFCFNKIISAATIILSIVLIISSFGIDLFLGRPGFGITQLVLALGGVALLFYGVVSIFNIRIEKSDKLIRLAISTTWALISTFSWVILAKNHMTCHIHINPIVFYLPFGITLFIFLGYWLDFLLTSARSRLGKI